MITVIRGAASKVAELMKHRADRLSQTELVFRWEMDPQLAPSWGAARSLIAQARTIMGDKAVERAIDPQRAMLSLVLRRLDSRLSAKEREQRNESSGLFLGSLPNVVLRRRPLLAAWGEAIASLLQSQRACVFIPELQRVDLSSLATIRAILQRVRGRGDLTFVIGHDPSFRPSEPMDAQIQALRERQVAVLEALPSTRVEAVATEPESSSEGDAATQGSANPTHHRIDADPLDDELEQRALQALRSGAGAPAEAFELGLAAMRAAFNAFGFDTSLRLGLAVAGNGTAEPSVRRSIHTIVALSSLNLDPLAKSKDWSTGVMVKHFTEALNGETDSTARAHLSYRLCMAHGRAKNDLPAALSFADSAVEISKSAAMPANRAAFFEGWARNGRAYARLRSGQAKGAAADCELALERIAQESLVGAPELEVKVLRLLLSNNRSKIAQATRDQTGLVHWRRMTREYLAALPPEDRPGHEWMIPPEDKNDLASSRDYFEGLLARARERLDPEAEAVGAHALGLIYYRLGDARSARDQFQTSLRIWQIMRGYPEDILTEELNCAVTAFRAGLLPEAEAGFERIRKNPLMTAESAQAETLGALAMVAAKRGQRDTSMARAQQALSIAEASGERDSLIRVLRSVGEAHLMLNRPADALRYLRRAMNVIDEAVSEKTPVAPEDHLGVLVGLLDCGGADDAVMLQALELLPPALVDPNAWWELPRLLVHVSNGLQRGSPPMKEDQRHALDRLLPDCLVAAVQRADCAKVAAQIEACIVGSERGL
jgi:tetratricopeptide (TPR) repeat protein